MKKLLAISAIAGALFAAGVADANAGSRSGSISGPRGNACRKQGSGNRRDGEKLLHVIALLLNRWRSA